MPRRPTPVHLATAPLILAAALASGICAGGVCAQERARPADTMLAGQVELARLVDVAAQRMRVNVEYDAAVLRGNVTLRLDAGVSDAELWALMNRLLAARGFTTVRAADQAMYSVVRVQDAAGLVRMQRELVQAGELQPGYQSVVVRIEHRPVREMVEAVGRVMSRPGGAAVSVGDDKLLVLSDLTPRLEQALEIIGMLDVPGPPVAIEEVPVHNLSAQALAALLGQVAAKREAVSGGAGARLPGELIVSPVGGSILVIAPESRLGSWRALIASLDRREPVETHWYAPQYFAVRDVAQLVEDTVRDPQGAGGGAGDERWRLVVDELTQTLIVTATPSQHAAVRMLIDRLDAAPQAARRPVRSFVIRNRSVGEVLRVLEQLVRIGALESEAAVLYGGVSDPQRSELPLAPGGSAMSPEASQMTIGAGVGADAAVPAVATSPRRDARGGEGAGADRLILTADEGTNTLIAVGEPRLLSQLESLLETLDVRQPQVMLEVLLLSLTESQALDLGVELEQLFSAGDVSVRLSSLFGLSVRGPGGTRTVGDGAGFTGVVLSPGDFAIVLRALQNINRGRSLSMPKLLVANNQSAVINSVLQQPFATINATPTVATTSFGGTQDAGTTVTIRPQIAQGDHLILNYSVALSSFVGSAPAAGLPPPRQQNQVQSLATIPDGYTVVVGGIDLENESQAITQVPLLGQIPLLGELFKSRAQSSNRSRFYVFIRANVLRGRGFEDLKYISDASIAATDRMIDDGWPTVEPRIIR